MACQNTNHQQKFPHHNSWEKILAITKKINETFPQTIGKEIYQNLGEN